MSVKGSQYQTWHNTTSSGYNSLIIEKKRVKIKTKEKEKLIFLVLIRIGIATDDKFDFAIFHLIENKNGLWIYININ